MTKAAGSGFYISIIYSKENENIAEKILKKFLQWRNKTKRALMLVS